MNYTDFIAQKGIRQKSHGFEIDPSEIHPKLFPFQRDSVLWALRKGRALLGLDTGLGKTYCSLEWARLIIKRGKVQRVLIVAPLSVARQTVKMSGDIDVKVNYVRGREQVREYGIYITNYEMVENFDPSQFSGVILDESSILKAIVGHYRQYLTKNFSDIPYRLCCTATPAPNDDAEIGMHSEYLGVNTLNEMLSMFFINANKVIEKSVDIADGRSVIMREKQGNKKGQEWRLRTYGKQQFYKWLSSWALMMSLPSDLGYDDNGFKLPSLNIEPVFIDVDYVPDGQLFFTKLKGIQDRSMVRHNTLDARVKVAADLCNASNEQWIAWCALSDESTALRNTIEDSIEVKGNDTPEYKAEMLEAFQDGKFKVLVTKPKIAGFGMNFQNAHNMAFVGLGDSWESYYQCIRRQWRFGQIEPVNVKIILSEIEREIYNNVMRKEHMAAAMKRELIGNIRLFEKDELGILQERIDTGYNPQVQMSVPSWLKGEMQWAMV